MGGRAAVSVSKRVSNVFKRPAAAALLGMLALVTTVHWLWPLFANPETEPITASLLHQSRLRARKTKHERVSSAAAATEEQEKPLFSTYHPHDLPSSSSNGGWIKVVEEQKQEPKRVPTTPFHIPPPHKDFSSLHVHGRCTFPLPSEPEYVEGVDWCDSTPLVVVCAGPCKQWVKKQAHRELPVVECRKKTSDKVCGLPGNTGREASSYLMFIVANYHRLPERMLFLHGHEKSWHQKPAVAEFWAATIRFAWEAKRFQGINNFMIGTKPGNGGKWDWEHGGEDGEAQRFKRQAIACDGSSQFVVPRDAVRRLPVEAYASLLAFCVEPSKWMDGFNVSSIPFKVSRRGMSQKCAFFLEWIWHIIFGETPVFSTQTMHNVKYNLVFGEGH